MKRLDFEQIKLLVHGAARIEENDGKISFFRFTKEQQEIYKSASLDFYMKSFSTSGISLEFETDSDNLSLSVEVSKGSSRTFFTHSLFIDGKRVDELSGNIGQNENVPFEKSFKLGLGMKKVRILFPWSVASSLVSLEIDDNAKVIPIEKKFKLLMLGDSITQGYDAMMPENAYAIYIAEKLNAEARNKGIAGECFFPRLVAEKENFEPNLITVAYGTNDWKYSNKEQFDKTSKQFYTNLRNAYPNVKIIALTPIWRVDIGSDYVSGVPLTYIGEYIKKVSQEIPDMTVIDCMDCVPHNPEYYQTDGVHPIDSGFKYYAKNLWKKMEELYVTF